MVKRCKFSRKRMFKNPEWLVLENGTPEEIKKYLTSRNFASFYKVPRFWIKEGKFQFFYVPDNLYNYIDKNYNNLAVVTPCHLPRPDKCWVEKSSEHDMSEMIDTEKDTSFMGLYILFKDKKEAAKFKLIV